MKIYQKITKNICFRSSKSLARMRRTEKILSWKYLPLVILFGFFIVYLLLALIKHNNFLSGYDLAIVDQVIWKYSQFKNPITTVHSYYNTSTLGDHIEYIYILLSPTYWILNDARTILSLQVISVVASGYAVYKLARFKKINAPLSLAILVSYLSFYGFQFAIWSDVHSLVFAVGFMAWFLYFLEAKNFKLSLLFFILAVICKEDIAFLTLLIAGVQFLVTRSRTAFIFCILSVLYLMYAFFIHYPLLTSDGYRYQNPNGLFADVSPIHMIDSKEKQQVILYSLGWYGFLPLLSPVYLVTFLGDLAHYFVLGKALVTSAQGIFLHYRSSVALLLVWPTIIAIARVKRLNSWPVALYLLICAAFFQYYLHLPFSYLAKQWFWQVPPSAEDIRNVIKKIPPTASIVSQNNITPHITHRDNIQTLWPETKDFKTNSPCGNGTCRWYKWHENPQYLIVDVGQTWDERHFLINREDFIEGIQNMEKEKVIIKEFQSGTATLYKIIRNP